MNISPVNNSQSFKGLWGKIDIFSRSSDDNFVHIATKNYHPFKDETKEEIAEVERFNSSKYEAAWFETGGINIKEERSVQTMAPLNFTKKEYEEVLAYALSLGIEQAFVQEDETADESFIPDFSLESLKKDMDQIKDKI